MNEIEREIFILKEFISDLKSFEDDLWCSEYKFLLKKYTNKLESLEAVKNPTLTKAK